MKKTIVWISACLLLFAACKKQSEPDQKFQDRLQQISQKYKLAPAAKSTGGRSFTNLDSLEAFLSARVRADHSKTAIMSSHSEAVITPTLEDLEIFKTFTARDPIQPPCHGANMTFTDAWNKSGYDGGTNMHIVVNYGTNGSKAVGGVNVTPTAYGATPDQYSVSSMQKTVSGDNIHITFTTTQTNVLHVGGQTFNSTSVTEWQVDLNTCSHTNTTNYQTALW